MNSDNIWSLFLLAIVTLFFVGLRLRKAKRIFVPDYQRGVRFIRGSFANVLGPGSYQPFMSKEQITVVDMRPQPIFLERVTYRDALQNESFMSIGAELQVSDPHLAATLLKDQINGSLPIVRDALRSVAS